MRTLLFSTARAGQTVESLHVNLQRAESRQNFSIWVYRDETLARGSGLFVGQDGVACSHHFLLPDDGTDFQLLAGEYVLRVFAKLVRDRSARELMAVRIRLSEAHAGQLQDEHTGICFDWGPDQQAYHPDPRICRTPCGSTRRRRRRPLKCTGTVTVTSDDLQVDYIPDASDHSSIMMTDVGANV